MFFSLTFTCSKYFGEFNTFKRFDLLFASDEVVNAK